MTERLSLSYLDDNILFKKLMLRILVKDMGFGVYDLKVLS